MRQKIAFAVTMLFLVATFLSPLFAEKAKEEKADQVKQVTLEVKNMVCAACPVTVKKSLTKLTGVKEAKVTLEPPVALVSYDASKVKVEDLIKATTNAGYPSTAKKK